eukprot:COSAG03_NODE_18958_length_345_cov_0.695122_1_plen_34_part_10
MMLSVVASMRREGTARQVRISDCAQSNIHTNLKS